MEKQLGIIHNAPRVESWEVSGVSCGGVTGTYEIIGEMTPAMPQDKLIDKYGLEIPSSELVCANVSRAYELRNQNPESAESLRAFLQKGFRQCSITSTRDFYMPEGNLDKVVHGYRTSDEHFIEGNFVGRDGWISELNDINLRSFLKAHLGTDDIEKIDKISKWINQTPFYVSRERSKPSEKQERVVRFVAGSDGLYLDCSWDLLDVRSAFRVLRVE